VLERRLDVEGHDVGRVEPLQARQVLGLDPVDQRVDVLPDLGRVVLVQRGHRPPSLLSVGLVVTMA
jgi:hypothetical protein